MAEEREPPAPETVSDRGQRLVAVPPARRRGRPRKDEAPPEAPRTLDEVVERHVRRTDVHTPDEEVPPDEPDPARRRQMTIGPMQLLPDAYDPDVPLPPEVRALAEEPREVPDFSDKTLRTLEDLNAHFDFDGSGQFYIMVTRQKPMHRNAVLTAGRMRDIKTNLTHIEFCEYYGGGQYLLIVYGPPARGRLIDPVTMKPKPKALTKPITVVVPYEGEGGREPNPLAALEYEADGDMQAMRPELDDMQSALIRRRTNTLADAKMLETATQKELTMDQRARDDRREDVRERRQQEASAVSVIREATTQTTEFLQEQLRQANEKIDRLVDEAKQPKSNGTDVGEVIGKVFEHLGPRQAGTDELDRMRASYEERLKNLAATHAERIKDMDERHRRELEDKEKVLAREKDDAVRRAEDTARYAKDQLEQSRTQLTADRNRERDDSHKERERMIADHARDTEMLKKDHERDMARQKEHWEARLTTEQSTNQRDREMLKESLTTRGELQKSSVDAELRQANNEITRLRADNDRLKAENDKNSNLPKRLKEFTDVAEGLGFARDEGGSGKDEPETWQQMMLRGMVTGMEKLPEIIKNAGDVLAVTRGAGAGGRGAPPPGMRPQFPQPQMAPPPGMPPAQRPMYPVTQVPPLGAWATEGSAEPSPMPEQYQAALPPPPRPTAPPVAMPPPQQSQPPPRRAPAPAPQAPPPAPAQAPPAVQVSDEDILRFAPTLEQWLESGDTPPEVLAERLMGVQPEIRLIAPALTPEAVAAALQRGGRGDSPLVRRDGQRFLARFRAAILGAP